MRPCRSRSAVRWRVRLRVGLRRALVDSTFLSLSGAETRCSSWARRHARASAQARVQGNGRLWRQPARVRCRRTRMMMQMGRHSRSPPARGAEVSLIPMCLFESLAAASQSHSSQSLAAHRPQSPSVHRLRPSHPRCRVRAPCKRASEHVSTFGEGGAQRCTG